MIKKIIWSCNEKESFLNLYNENEENALNCRMKMNLKLSEKLDLDHIKYQKNWI